MQACPTEEELFLYLAGTLEESESDRVRTHVMTCSTCRELVVFEARGEAPALLAGKYAIERELGSGGMGRVVLARHVKLDKLVAIKMIHAEFLRDPNVVERFTREARAAAALKSRHCVQVLDIDTSASGEPFIVMDRLHGTDLDSKVLREGPLPLLDAVRYIREACAALAEAHDVGILHRDVKPANLFLADVDGGGVPIVKFLDFGLAKALPGGTFVTAEATSLTAKSDLVGSPRFMSPEQFGGEVDHRTDIWSIGVTLYFLLSGEHPFVADDLAKLRESIVSGAHVPLATRRPDLPVGILGAIDRCLATRREDRWNSIRDFVLALGQPESDRAIDRRGGMRRAPFEVGRYTVLRRIAAGGMGTVYLARSRGALGFSRPVAVKQLHSHLALDEAIRRRFLAEARVVSHIDHPHVVKVLDVVEDDGEVFLVLDYVHGETLHHLLAMAQDRSVPTAPAILSSIFGQSAEALHAAHEAVDDRGEPLGLVHRDVSPHNVLVAKQGAAYITDFGIAKVAAQLADTHRHPPPLSLRSLR